MKRDLLANLKKWKTSQIRKPLILRGARQVGKSWLAKEIGKDFESFVEINFEKNPEIKDFFQGNLNPEYLIDAVSNYFGKDIIPGKTLLFFDEIQMCPKAITALRYFYEEMPELHVISAGSLLEFELRKISIPVGRISFLYVYPLSFGEYLTAIGKEKMRSMIIENKFNKLPLPFHDLLLKEIRNFTLIGGLPEVVKTVIDTKSFENCMEVQEDIIQTYRTDFYKYAKDYQIKYLEKVFNSIPHQVGNKFKYSAVDREIRSKFLGEALDMLEMAGIAYKIHHSSSNGIPLGAEIDFAKFKVLFFDVGLAQRLMRLDYKNSLLDADIFKINNGTIAELFTGTEIISYSNSRSKAELYYWHREARSSNAEIDYVTTINNEITPVEVKSGTTGRMKSLKIFMESKNCSVGIKVSEYPYSFHDYIQSIPFYGIESLIKNRTNMVI